jgi:hypothetical protein
MFNAERLASVPVGMTEEFTSLSKWILIPRRCCSGTICSLFSIQERQKNDGIPDAPLCSFSIRKDEMVYNILIRLMGYLVCCAPAGS